MKGRNIQRTQLHSSQGEGVAVHWNTWRVGLHVQHPSTKSLEEYSLAHLKECLAPLRKMHYCYRSIRLYNVRKYCQIQCNVYEILTLPRIVFLTSTKPTFLCIHVDLMVSLQLYIVQREHSGCLKVSDFLLGCRPFQPFSTKSNEATIRQNCSSSAWKIIICPIPVSLGFRPTCIYYNEIFL